MESIHLTKPWARDQASLGPETAYFDRDLLTYPLTVRKWEKGDYFYPIGMSGKKKLSKFFKDEKYSLLQKENIWLLCSGAHIIWVIGKRIDNRYIVSDKTKNILKATLHR
jgi:tRNA(Ile)-lysidine synthase